MNTFLDLIYVLGAAGWLAATALWLKSCPTMTDD
jgi:hypothetical protein